MEDKLSSLSTIMTDYRLSIRKLSKTYSKMNIIEIYERLYDNPMLPDGQEKPNKFLGKFQVIQVINQNMYCSITIGRMINTNDIYLIQEIEVWGYNGGSRFEITKLNNLKLD